jgi:hypothetical protein
MQVDKKINHSREYYFFKMIIDIHLALNNEVLAPQVKDTLIFFCMHGINNITYKMLLFNKIATSLNVIHSYKTLLQSKGFIKKIKESKWEVINIKPDPTCSFNIKLSLNGKDQEVKPS